MGLLDGICTAEYFEDASKKPKILFDLLGMLELVIEKHVHGNRDDNVLDDSGNVIVDNGVLRYEKIVNPGLNCSSSSISNTMAEFLLTRGINARTVEIISAHEDDKDLSHTCLEVYFKNEDKKSWMHVDLDMGVMFKDVVGYLSSVAILDYCQPSVLKYSQVPVLNKMKKDLLECHEFESPLDCLDIIMMSEKKTDQSLNGDWVAGILNNSSLIREWYATKMGAIMIGEDIYCPNESLIKKIRANLKESKRESARFYNQRDFCQRNYNDLFKIQ